MIDDVDDVLSGILNTKQASESSFSISTHKLLITTDCH